MNKPTNNTKKPNQQTTQKTTQKTKQNKQINQKHQDEKRLMNFDNKNNQHWINIFHKYH